jgi:hypothetical protein
MGAASGANALISTPDWVPHWTGMGVAHGANAVNLQLWLGAALAVTALRVQAFQWECPD